MMPFSGSELLQQFSLAWLNCSVAVMTFDLALTVISPPPLSKSIVMMPCFFPDTEKMLQQRHQMRPRASSLDP